jgi:hypothetical protein
MKTILCLLTLTLLFGCTKKSADNLHPSTPTTIYYDTISFEFSKSGSTTYDSIQFDYWLSKDTLNLPPVPDHSFTIYHAANLYFSSSRSFILMRPWNIVLKVSSFANDPKELGAIVHLRTPLIIGNKSYSDLTDAKIIRLESFLE